MFVKRDTLLLILGIGFLSLVGCPKETTKAVSQTIQAQKPTQKTPDAADPSMGGLTGKWRATKIGDNKLPADADFVLSFAEGSVHAKICNNFRVEVKTAGGGFSQSPRPRERYGERADLCTQEVAIAERNFIYAFERAVRFKIDKNTLHLMSGKTVLITAERISESKIAGKWRVVDIARTTLPPNALLSLEFKDGEVFLAACSTLVAKIDTQAGRFSPGRLVMHRQDSSSTLCNTKMLGAQRHLVDALQRAVRFEIDKDGLLNLITNKTILIKAKRAQ